MKNYLEIVREARRLQEESKQLILHARKVVQELEELQNLYEIDRAYSLKKYMEKLRKNRPQ